MVRKSKKKSRKPHSSRQSVLVVDRNLSREKVEDMIDKMAKKPRIVEHRYIEQTDGQIIGQATRNFFVNSSIAATMSYLWTKIVQILRRPELPPPSFMARVSAPFISLLEYTGATSLLEGAGLWSSNAITLTAFSGLAGPLAGTTIFVVAMLVGLHFYNGANKQEKFEELKQYVANNDNFKTKTEDIKTLPSNNIPQRLVSNLSRISKEVALNQKSKSKRKSKKK